MSTGHVFMLICRDWICISTEISRLPARHNQHIRRQTHLKAISTNYSFTNFTFFCDFRFGDFFRMWQMNEYSRGLFLTHRSLGDVAVILKVCFSIRLIIHKLVWALLLKSLIAPLVARSVTWHKHTSSATDNKIRQQMCVHISCNRLCIWYVFTLQPRFFLFLSRSHDISSAVSSLYSWRLVKYSTFGACILIQINTNRIHVIFYNPHILLRYNLTTRLYISYFINKMDVIINNCGSW